MPSSPTDVGPEARSAGAPAQSKNAFLALLALLCAAGIIHASTLSFVTDDAFISFRYAKNLVNGMGLVFNPGERVEGFTNFLWTLIIAAGMKFGWEPVAFSTRLGIAFGAATIGLACWLSFRRSRGRVAGGLFLPLAAALLVLHHDFAAFATGGLETMFVTFLLTAAYALLADAPTPRHLLFAGMLMVCAMMARPDAVVFLAAMAAFLAFTGERPLRELSAFLAPTVLLFAPYWAWRAAYFGFFFPNAFYAKSIVLPYYGQGWTYIALFFSSYYVFLALPFLAAVVLALRRRTPGPAASATFRESLRTGSAGRGTGLALLLVLVQTAFIFRIGGDFMFARFFIPVVPLLCVIAEEIVDGIPSHRLRVTVAAALCLATVFRWDPFTSEARRVYIADEQRWYTQEHLEQSRRDGATLHHYFQGLPVKVAFWAGQVKLIYYADPFIAREASAGLTDTAIAHQPIETRGRPGHEKQATSEYLLERGTNFLFGPFSAPPAGGDVLDMIVFDSIAAKIVTYENPVMEKLAAFPGVHFVPVPRYLDGYIRTIDSVPPDRLARDYAFFRSFYFLHNQDEEREHPFIARLRRF